MKRNILTLFFALFAMIHVSAQTYDTLWKQASAFEQKDQPRSELAVMDKIMAKAQADRNYGQMLAARLRAVSLWNAVSPDSLAPARQRLVGEKNRTDDPVNKAVCQAALARLYREAGNADSALILFRQALSRPELLSARQSGEFSPLTLQTTTGKSFDHDLLHLIGYEADTREAYQLMHDYYLKAGRRTSACLCAYQITQKDRKEDVQLVRKSRYLHTIDSLVNVYQDLPEAGELALEHYRFMERATDASVADKITYINYALNHWGGWPRMNELRNAQRELTNPNLTVENIPLVMRPGQKTWVQIQARNLQTLKVSVSRLDITADNDYRPENKDTYKLLQSKTSALHQKDFDKRFYGHPDYETVKDSFQLGSLPLGAYLLEITPDNDNVAPQRRLFYVSDLALMAQALPDGTRRYVVANATSGQPVSGATLVLYQNGNKKNNYKRIVKAQLTTDAQGEAYTKERNCRVLVYTSADKYTPSDWLNLYSRTYNPQKNDTRRTKIYTDRAIYRPGQTLHVSAISYIVKKGTDACAASQGEEVKFTLRNANGKLVEEKSAKTDSYGTSSVDFLLPADGPTGRYSVSASGGFASVRVEEYKRPTFDVQIPEVNQRYQWGDTIVVKASAKTYAGVPVQGAKAQFSVTRQSARWWWRNDSGDEEVFKGEATTGSDGSFLVSIPLVPDLLNGNRSESDFLSCPRFYTFDVQATVTDLSGESHEARMSLPIGTRPTAFSVNIPSPARMEVDSLKTLTFSYMNNAGHAIDGRLKWRVNGGDWHEAKTNQPVDVRATDNRQMSPNATDKYVDGNNTEGIEWKSGKYVLEAVCGQDSLRQEFMLFSMKDTHPVETTTEWYYQTTSVFPHDGRPAYIQVGTSENGVHVVYSLVSGNTLLEKGSWELSDSIVTLPFTYKAEYESGVVLNYCFVKNGEYYSKNIVIERPLPEKKLNVAWKTFRNRLTPGQKEEWTLTLTTPDGRPAKAQLMSVLFDKSLQQLASHSWSLPLNFHQSLPCFWWDVLDKRVGAGAYASQSFKRLEVPGLDVDHFDDTFFSLSRTLRYRNALAIRGTGAHIMYAAKSAGRADADDRDGSMMMSMMASDVAIGNEGYPSAGNGREETAEVDEQTLHDKEAHNASLDNIKTRQNLSETAFFQPALQSNDKGEVSIRFTLPESLTTWRFMALAHDREMNNGVLTDEAVARKSVMVQPNLPRFLREGDESTVQVKIFNTSEKSIAGNVRMQMIDPETEKVVWQEVKHYQAQPESSVLVAFVLDKGRLPEGIYINKVVAEAGGQSDGEQSYLPVLSNRETVVNTLPITLMEKGRHAFDLAGLFTSKDQSQTSVDDAKVTIEYSNNPAWLMIQALPAVGTPDADNAISLMAAVYSNSLSRYLMEKAPAVKDLMKTHNVTPDLVQTQASKLLDLQQSNGSFGWWKGMCGNRYVTVSVAEMMVRLNRMMKGEDPVGVKSTTDKMLASAMDYLQREVAEEVKEMKKREKEHQTVTPSTVAVHYLYLLSLDGRRLSASGENDRKYLLGKLADRTCDVSITAKARTAIVLGKNGYASKAKDYLQSIREYTVYKPGMGRYFDTRKAEYSWRSYKIPTQVAALEALRLLAPADRQTIVEMQQWLLQEKRTQAWDNPLNTVDAVYAFLDGNDDVLLKEAEHATLKLDGKTLRLPKATPGVGYVKVEKEGKPSQLTIEKNDDKTSWGAVYAQYSLPSSRVTGLASGLRVERVLTVNGKEVKNAHGALPLQVGDKVTVTLTLTADRDYDLVELNDHRAACLEPVNQLSGYDYRLGAYVAPRDEVTAYYFNQLAKGRHQVSTEYYVDRAGIYHSGSCSVQCTYGPEFAGRSEAYEVNTVRNE